jgi:outer membrane protein assembly factor BamB
MSSLSNPAATSAAAEAIQLPRKPRLWPGVLIVVLMWLAMTVPAALAHGTMIHFIGLFWSPMLATLAVLIWWLAASRLPWRDRWTGLAAFVAAVLVAMFLGHSTMRIVVIMLGLPILLTVWVGWSLLARRLRGPTFRGGLVALLLLIGGGSTVLRMNGLTGGLNVELGGRWSATPESRFMAGRGHGVSSTTRPTSGPAILTIASAEDWPGFRGPRRDGRVLGTHLRADWNSNPPKLLWKRLVGPGWSSFCVVGGRAFTQEQRDQIETVVCYDAATGLELWAHENRARFDETMGGPGPRATPTFADGRLYALGAMGRLNCIDASIGRLIWTRDVQKETGANLPNWGFSASPLVTGGRVIVITGGPGKATAAYDAATGDPAWAAGDGFSYASAHLATLAGVQQLLFPTAQGIAALDPASGKELWRHDFPLPVNANRCVQPAALNDSDVLLGAAFGVGTRRLHVTRDPSGAWTQQTVWTARTFKPYFNDFVIHHDHAYGFDDTVLVCVDLATGKSKWRSHDYGAGQVVLLADQDLLLVASERGEAALVDAKPDGFREIGRFQAIEGKTWNHPVVVGGRLFMRNGEEAASYALD